MHFLYKSYKWFFPQIMTFCMSIWHIQVNKSCRIANPISAWILLTWTRCLVSTATGLPSLMLSVNQLMSNTCTLGRSFRSRPFSHVHSDRAWLFSDTTWVTVSLRREETRPVRRVTVQFVALFRSVKVPLLRLKQTLLRSSAIFMEPQNI